MSLARRTALGAAFAVAFGLSSRLVGLVATLLLTRYIAPAEYGEVAVALIVVMTLNQASTLGVGNYLTAHPDAPPAVTFHATVLHLGLGLVAFLVAVTVGARLAPHFDAPTAARYVPLLAATALIDRAGTMPERLLLRRLAFRRVSLTRALGEVAYATAAIVAAVFGLGGMAIVAGNVARSSLRATGFVSAVPLREWLVPAPLEKKTFALLARHGFWVSLAALFEMASCKWDNIVIGKLFGPAAAGTYNLAYNLAELPALQVGEPITDVLQISYAHASPEGRQKALLRTVSLVALIMAPLAFGLGALSETLTGALFPRSWAGLGPFLLPLALISFARPLDGVVVAYLQARSEPRAVALVDALGLALLLGLMWFVGRSSPSVACAMVVASFLVRALLYFALLRSMEGVAYGALLTASFRPLLSGALMGGAVLFLGRTLTTPPLVTLAAQLAAGAALYGVLAFVVTPASARDLVGVVRDLIARRTKRG